VGDAAEKRVLIDEKIGLVVVRAMRRCSAMHVSSRKTSSLALLYACSCRRSHAVKDVSGRIGDRANVSQRGANADFLP
jgi:hypothetical protein